MNLEIIRCGPKTTETTPYV